MYALVITSVYKGMPTGGVVHLKLRTLLRKMLNMSFKGFAILTNSSATRKQAMQQQSGCTIGAQFLIVLSTDPALSLST